MRGITTRFPARAAGTRVAVVTAAVLALVSCRSSSPPDTSVASPTAAPAVQTRGTTTTGAPNTVATTFAPTTTVPISAGVPAYFAPGMLWDVMLGTANTGDARVSMAVINPSNGPGAAADAAYAAVVAAAKAKGVRILGYVATGYATRTSVLDDIDAYKRFYDVTDIFLDEATSDCTTLATYTPWIAAVRANGGVAAVNPGIVPAPCWGTAADIIVTFEGPFEAYLRYVSPPWTRALPSTAFWSIVYAVPPESAGFVREVAARQHTGLLYATEDVLPNPYDSLPAALSVVTTPPSTLPLITAAPIPLPPVAVSTASTTSTAPTAPTAPTAAIAATTTTSTPLIIVLEAVPSSAAATVGPVAPVPAA